MAKPANEPFSLSYRVDDFHPMTKLVRALKIKIAF